MILIGLLLIVLITVISGLLIYREKRVNGESKNIFTIIGIALGSILAVIALIGVLFVYYFK